MSQAPLKSIVLEQGLVVNVLVERVNKVIGRVEVSGELIHVKEGTPQRGLLKEALAKAYGKPPECVVVKRVSGEYGSHRSRFEANIYDAIERLKFFEPEYLIRRG